MAEIEVRQLRADELGEAWQLGRLAFGGGSSATPPAPDAPGVTRLGAFDRDGRLVGKATDLHHGQWWGGAVLGAVGIGGVAVLPEHRGAGTSRQLLGAVLGNARERGAALSALYPTVSAVYRSAGWVMGGELRSLEIPTAVLPRHRPDPGVEVRPGGPAELAATRDVYTAVARDRNGMLHRSGGPFAGADSFPDGVDGVSVVEEAGQVAGFATWQRGSGYDRAAVLTVVDALAITAPAARALIGVLATWRNVAPTTRFRALASEAVAAELPLEAAVEHRSNRFMLRAVDVVAAVDERPVPTWLQAGARFALEDDLAPWNTGTWELEVEGGRAHLTPSGGRPSLHLGPAGFAALYAGLATPSTLVGAGLARPGHGDPSGLCALHPTTAPELLDYF